MPGRNLRASGLGVFSVWMNRVRRWEVAARLERGNRKEQCFGIELGELQVGVVFKFDIDRLRRRQFPGRRGAIVWVIEALLGELR